MINASFVLRRADRGRETAATRKLTGGAIREARCVEAWEHQAATATCRGYGGEETALEVRGGLVLMVVVVVEPRGRQRNPGCCCGFVEHHSVLAFGLAHSWSICHGA